MSLIILQRKMRGCRLTNMELSPHNDLIENISSLLLSFCPGGILLYEYFGIHTGWFLSRFVYSGPELAMFETRPHLCHYN